MRHSIAGLRAVLAAAVLIGIAVPVALADDLAPSTITATWWATSEPLQEHHVITLESFVSTTVDGFADDSTVTFAEVDGRAPSCVAPTSADGETFCEIPTIHAGSYQYTATYSGNALVAGSVSEPFDLTIAPDTVDATNVGRDLAKFYPMKDGYRDVVTISGKRSEPISVTINIFNSAGHRVEAITRSLGTGTYHAAWSGRTPSGSVLPAGRYRIVQKLVDAAGTTRSFTSYTKLSRKVLVTRMVYVTKAGNKLTAAGHRGGGTVKVSSGGGYAVLQAKKVSDWAGAGYQFKVPDAVVYKKLRFQAYTDAPRSVPANEVAMQNFRYCPTKSGPWDLGCFDHFRAVSAAGGRQWSSSPGNPSADRKGRTVRGIVSIQFGTAHIYKARVKVVYQVWR